MMLHFLSFINWTIFLAPKLVPIIDNYRLFLHRKHHLKSNLHKSFSFNSTCTITVRVSMQCTSGTIAKTCAYTQDKPLLDFLFLVRCYGNHAYGWLGWSIELHFLPVVSIKMDYDCSKIWWNQWSIDGLVKMKLYYSFLSTLYNLVSSVGAKPKNC